MRQSPAQSSRENDVGKYTAHWHVDLIDQHCHRKEKGHSKRPKSYSRQGKCHCCCRGGDGSCCWFVHCVPFTLSSSSFNNHGNSPTNNDCLVKANHHNRMRLMMLLLSIPCAGLTHWMKVNMPIAHMGNMATISNINSQVIRPSPSFQQTAYRGQIPATNGTNQRG